MTLAFGRRTAAQSGRLTSRGGRLELLGALLEGVVLDEQAFPFVKHRLNLIAKLALTTIEKV